ncbi:hypothetical protein KNU78_gp10 [Gordonia phage Sukkupi]|uniref:Uncharacterized protein n=1 Tax=Gordonia phage Sukkupi TaxID=2653747 RepID=A0A5Q2WNG6_9CAUD|nr:hypothetical protein KNU78_gp10 [Gordonia phage Sukkupi]QAU07059.1 hypothetical protein SEA_BIPAUNETO_10 [Gordonia phage BiPauneto]QGH79253.1 hypothetical protein SEA_SUKKUPI_10 [Gordonia phage Sukkupi]QGH80726.1 hypothetical protein SEA_YNDEXA_10 [Gordonia phage Yndexa]
MSTKEPAVALKAYAEQVVRLRTGELRHHPATRGRIDMLTEHFLNTWHVAPVTEVAQQREATAEWQQEAKLVIALLLTAMNNVAPQLGDTVLAEAERIVVARGLDPEEVLARFTP